MRPSPFSLTLLLSLAALPAAEAAPAADFWATWGDGKAELSGYRLRRDRYGQRRDGTAVLIFVTEDFLADARVKADKPDKARSYPVLKLNLVRKFQTGIYDYSILTSVFSRVDPPGDAGRPWPWQKISFSSQEWCGHVYHQLLPDGAGALRSHSHSYFEGEADQALELPLPKDAVSEDELPLLLRSYAGKPDYLAPGQQRRVPLLRSLQRVRLNHQPLAFTPATVRRAPAPAPQNTALGALPAFVYTVTLEGGASGTYAIEAAPPHRVLGWRWPDEEASITGTARLPYWNLNGNEGTAYLKQLGLPLPPARDR